MMIDIFKDLNKEEIKEFRQWARNHPENLNIFEQKIGAWHPIVIAEYQFMQMEAQNDS
jgi:hypothetical protein